MYKKFDSFADLKAHIDEDKHVSGMGAETLNRYPVRFVLFDNFRDCFDFVSYMQHDRGAYVESVVGWMESAYPDVLIGQMELATRIDAFITKQSPNDGVVAPFSELARFYDNSNRKEFETLIRTVKSIQASGTAQNQRIYIPLVGLEGKMEAFREDSQIVIWRLHSKDEELNYKLILTKGTDFGIKGLDERYTVVENIREWLNIWKDSKKQVTPTIICKSPCIYANAHYAQPDNAFVYATCHNAYEFLTDGLDLKFGGIQQQPSDGDNWDLLARQIDISKGFDFGSFVQSYFSINSIDGYKDFIRLWFHHPSTFDRWLLARYYADFHKTEEPDYLCRHLATIHNYGTNELIEQIACDLTEITSDMEVRKYCLKTAADMGVRLTNSTEGQLAKSLTELPQRVGYPSTLTRYFSGISRKEQELAIKWLGQGFIQVDDVKDFYPDLYTYAKDGVGVSTGNVDWVEDYMSKYKKAKIANNYTEDIKQRINELNASETTFDVWYNKFSTTYTLLQNRKDIEVFYWIDGLGVDWIPLVKQIVAEKKDQQIYVNEVLIARAKLPTKTENNKLDLQRLLPADQTLEKSGDLDALAHYNTNISPFVLIDEIELVRDCVEKILMKYIGKKIAIISDHGLTYLSQLREGLNMGGVSSDHYGRVAIRDAASNVSDSSYMRVEDDNKILCALKHESLCKKVPNGQGAHGGCTPEEVLVPIFIISSAPAACNWSAELLTAEVKGSNPRVQIQIMNLPNNDNPHVIYNGKTYGMKHLSGEIYESEDLLLDKNETVISLQIGAVSKLWHIVVSTGVEEEDLFDF